MSVPRKSQAREKKAAPADSSMVKTGRQGVAGGTHTVTWSQRSGKCSAEYTHATSAAGGMSTPPTTTRKPGSACTPGRSPSAWLRSSTNGTASVPPSPVSPPPCPPAPRHRGGGAPGTRIGPGAAPEPPKTPLGLLGLVVVAGGSRTARYWAVWAGGEILGGRYRDAVDSRWEEISFLKAGGFDRGEGGRARLPGSRLQRTQKGPEPTRLWALESQRAHKQ